VENVSFEQIESEADEQKQLELIKLNQKIKIMADEYEPRDLRFNDVKQFY